MRGQMVIETPRVELAGHTSRGLTGASQIWRMRTEILSLIEDVTKCAIYK